MLKKMGINVVRGVRSFRCGVRSFLLTLMWCVALLVACFSSPSIPLQRGTCICPPLAGAQGVDSYTKLMLHADGSDQGTPFTDSSSGAKTVTNTESYDYYTKLMLKMENNVTDSASGKTVTNNNVTFSSSAYKMGSYSGMFNGSSSYLSLADSDDWNFGSGDFTIDFWFRANSLKSGGEETVPISQVQGYDPHNFWNINIRSNRLIFQVYSAHSRLLEFETTPTFNTATWYHLAIVRSGSTWYMFKDGTQIGTTTSSITMPDLSGALYIGDQHDNIKYFDGYIDELRISKGVARWTSDFTPPASPYGRVATVTSQKKFGTTSGEFHGSGDYLSLADSDDWNFGSGDFTIDTWVNFNNIANTDTIFHQQQMYPNWTEASQVTLRKDRDGSLFFSAYGNSVFLADCYTPANTITQANVWYHIALVKYSGIYQYYVNGAKVTTTTEHNNTLPDINGDPLIGTTRLSGYFSYFMNGYLDEFRISKGIARWTSDFTPPTAPYDTDTTPPTISSTSPASSATGVGVGSAVSATFSEDMDSSTITTSTFTLTSSGGSSVSGNSVGWVKRSAPNESTPPPYPPPEGDMGEECPSKGGQVSVPRWRGCRGWMEPASTPRLFYPILMKPIGLLGLLRLTQPTQIIPAAAA